MKALIRFISKPFYVLFLFLILCHLTGFAQEKQPYFIGLQPSITQESWYDKDEFDINVVPFVFQTPVGKLVDFRFTTLANYHFGSEKGFSDIGFQAVFPAYFKKKASREILSHGFYVGPVLGFSRNALYDHYTTTLAIEPGYMFKTKKSFSLALGLQLGGSYFSYDNNPNKWVTHFGLKINLGFWVNKGDK